MFLLKKNKIAITKHLTVYSWRQQMSTSMFVCGIRHDSDWGSGENDLGCSKLNHLFI